MSGFFNIVNQFTELVQFAVFVISSIINNLSIYFTYVFQVMSMMPMPIYSLIASFLLINMLYLWFFHK